jgi:K+-transporting ATPase ATPase A chain
LVNLIILVFGHLLGDALHPPAYLLSAAWYAISSMLNNNGSGFSGYFIPGSLANFISGLLMLIGRFIPIILAFAVAGIINKQQVMEVKTASFNIDSLLFSIVSLVVILIVTLLAFLPLWSLGPLASQGLLMLDGFKVTP